MKRSSIPGQLSQSKIIDYSSNTSHVTAVVSSKLSFKNINIKIPSSLLAQLKIIAIKKNCFTKDLIISYLKNGVNNEPGNN